MWCAADQSAGKSSVIESISGIQLPRGTGIVTRVPLELQLRAGDTVKAELSYAPAGGTAKVQQFSDLAEVTQAVQKATEDVAGTNKGVVDSPLQLRICMPDAPNLTLIDLPGIARIPVGDQPDNIYDLIKALNNKYLAGNPYR